MKIRAKRVLTPEGFLSDKTIFVENGRILGIGAAEPSEIECDTAVPGFIDEHLHGGFGADVMHSDEEKLLNWLEFLAQNGTTEVLSGVYTASVPTMRKALDTAKKVMELQKNGAKGARLTGVHLEGPFISKNALGAMDIDSVIEPTMENYQRITEGYEDMIRLITIAPENEGAHDLAEKLNAKGIAVLAGHTAATAEEGEEAFRHGFGGICHFFNASTPIKHRAPGILTEALLEDQVYTECICDFVHVHKQAVQLIHKVKGADRMIIVSDAVSTTGLPDGIYGEGKDATVVKNGESRTLSGSLNGGGCVQLREIKNLISAGIPEEDAFKMASETPARFLRMPGGRIVPGAFAEIVCLNSENDVLRTVIGNDVYEGL